VLVKKKEAPRVKEALLLAASKKEREKLDGLEADLRKALVEQQDAASKSSKTVHSNHG